MDLRCKTQNLWGRAVNVRGTIYNVSLGGLCKDVDPAHAEILLQNKRWSIDGEELSASPAPVVGQSELDRLVALSPRELITIARDLGISVLGKDQKQAAEAILARRLELEAARQAESSNEDQTEGEGEALTDDNLQDGGEAAQE